MSTGFWHPAHELQRLAHGWLMPRTRHGNVQGAIVPNGRDLQVWIRDGDRAIQVGVENELGEAAWVIWAWGREGSFDRKRRRPPA